MSGGVQVSLCKHCGTELQRWRTVERDEDNGEYYEYDYSCCPNCGAATMKVWEAADECES